jgi:hypothetical protein
MYLSSCSRRRIVVDQIDGGFGCDNDTSFFIGNLIVFLYKLSKHELFLEKCITFILIGGIFGRSPDNCAATTFVTGGATTLDAGVEWAD